MVSAPTEVSPSKWNPGPKMEVIKEPRVLRPEIASIGVIPRYLFLIGYTEEQFRKTFGNKFVELNAGKAMNL